MIEWVGLLAACSVAYIAHSKALTHACLRAMQTDETNDDPDTVSVVVCIKDDAEHWPAWWAAMKRQQWPIGTEIIAIDDGSTDELPALLTLAAQEKVPFKFAHHRIDGTSPGKRDALRFGVEQASGEWVLLTDVDCLPAGPAWATEMTAGCPDDVAAVLGVSWPRDQTSATWLARVQALDAVYITRSYVGWTERGKPYMGVGRNLAMRRSAFPGFSNAPATASGDDDMMIQALASAPGASIAVAAHRAAQMDAAMPSTWSDWLAQKRRHWSTAPHYRVADQGRMAVPKLLRTAVFVTAVGAVVVHNSLWITGALLGGMWLSELLNFRSITKAYQAPYSWRNRGALLPFWSAWSAWVALSLMWKRQDKRKW